MTRLLLTLLLIGTWSSGVHAQGAGQGGVTPGQTNKVVSAISNMFGACRDISVVYQPDCLSRALQRGAGKISNNPGYWEAHVALTRASRAMTRLVRQYSDSETGRVRVEGYRLYGVAEASLPAVERAAVDIMSRVQEDLEMLSHYEREAFRPIGTLLSADRPWP